MPGALRLTTKTLNKNTDTRGGAATPAVRQQKRTSNKKQAVVNNLKGGKEKLVELHEQVSQYAAANERKHALNAFKQCTYLTNISLAPIGFPDFTAEKWALIEEEVCQNQSICLNGVDIGKGSTACRSPTELQSVLTAVCNKVAAAAAAGNSSSNKDDNTHKGPGVYAAILLRLMLDDENSAITTQVGQAIACGGLELQTMNPDNNDNNNRALVDLYESGGCIHATFQTTHAFALFHPDQPDRPWIKLTAVVHERANLSTAVSVRRLAIRWPRK